MKTPQSLEDLDPLSPLGRKVETPPPPPPDRKQVTKDIIENRDGTWETNLPPPPPARFLVDQFRDTRMKIADGGPLDPAPRGRTDYATIAGTDLGAIEARVLADLAKGDWKAEKPPTIRSAYEIFEPLKLAGKRADMAIFGDLQPRPLGRQRIQFNGREWWLDDEVIDGRRLMTPLDGGPPIKPVASRIAPAIAKNTIRVLDAQAPKFQGWYYDKG